MKKYILSILSLLFLNTTYSQVLYEETFDSLTIGDFTTDPTAAVPGQGNWYVSLKGITEAKIAQEPNRGKVLTILKPTNNITSFIGEQRNLQTLWNNRTAGNDILLAEYDYYSEDIDVNHGLSFRIKSSTNKSLIQMGFSTLVQLNETKIGLFFHDVQSPDNLISKNINNYTQSWGTVKVYIDYNTNKVYLHVPALGFLHSASYTNTIDPVNTITLSTGEGTSSTYTGITNKFDNIRLTAIKTLPQELLSTENFLSEQFNLYPNPATNVVSITNSENRLVNQVIVYDVAGKQLSVQTFKNEAKIQLNVENLASGVYLLHIETNEGTAVKKLVKK